MTVQQLIALLQTMPQDAEVVTFIPDTATIVDASYYAELNSVMLSHDIDLS